MNPIKTARGEVFAEAPERGKIGKAFDWLRGFAARVDGGRESVAVDECDEALGKIADLGPDGEAQDLGPLVDAFRTAKEGEREGARINLAGAIQAERSKRVAVPADIEAWEDAPEPAPIIGRAAADPMGETALADPVLRVGEVCLLSARGGSGKSYLSLGLAAAAAKAWQSNQRFGETCGLAIRSGPTVIVSLEDGPETIYHRLIAIAGEVGEGGKPKPLPKGVYVPPESEPLFEAAPADSAASGKARPTSYFTALWAAIGRMNPKPSLVIIDPASVALADVSVSESGPVRAFIASLMAESRKLGAGVLVIAHSTKADRDSRASGQYDGAGVVAGSAAWFDAARGCLVLDTYKAGDAILQCFKSNHGRTGWGSLLRERMIGSVYCGRELEQALDHAGEVAAKRAELEARDKPKPAPKAKAKAAPKDGETKRETKGKPNGSAASSASNPPSPEVQAYMAGLED